MPIFIKKNISDKVLLEKFEEMQYATSNDKIKIDSNRLKFLNNIDAHCINFIDTKKYIGDECIYNVIKETNRDKNIKQLNNSNYILIYVKINPNTSLEAIEHFLWVLSTIEEGHNVTYIIKNDEHFSEETAENLVIGIKKINNHYTF
ncbi:hypothetical protein [Candidatus Sulfurimonas baltica]|uniref:Uncharacterized protein n=1 Tax=Candidatus Sulfurimonas baltica TaxID=2740404 RepID=A0A7S7LYQ6_9BACT|nr:hypothetical protein [Candidatus Sulfurimonas baltica]QOY53029.1 hypothetical protein HUE88_04930 [Candidatus Sulfurimonas baltica]